MPVQVHNCRGQSLIRCKSSISIILPVTHRHLLHPLWLHQPPRRYDRIFEFFSLKQSDWKFALERGKQWAVWNGTTWEHAKPHWPQKQGQEGRAWPVFSRQNLQPGGEASWRTKHRRSPTRESLICEISVKISRKSDSLWTFLWMSSFNPLNFQLTLLKALSECLCSRSTNFHPTLPKIV